MVFKILLKKILKTIDCESEPCVVRADAPVIGEEPNYGWGERIRTFE
jgi:hypothetical protein